MNKDLEQKIKDESCGAYWNPREPEMIKAQREAYIEGTKSDAMLDYVIERAVELSRRGYVTECFEGMVMDYEFSEDKIKSIIKQEVK